TVFSPSAPATASLAAGLREAELEEIARATYELDNPRAPQSLEFTATNKSRVFSARQSSLEIVKYDDESFTTQKRGAAPVRWIRVDPNRYFIVLAARSGEFYDQSGSAFPILIKLAGSETQTEAVGTYSAHGKRAFGAISPATFQDYMREPRNDSEVMLRLEINPQQYERALKIMRTWERRARDGELLYPNDLYLNNIVLLKAVTETLNQCSEEIKLYKLNYIHPEDWISNTNSPGFVPFAYFKELRRLNETLHVRDNRFPLASLSVAAPR
ncbi:MAG TPA: hypothetical protein VGN90_08480, partial [Pyrinomonadaceae bacterium]|nr:hypothetical protein [Pyrinomonadaceae bacterium]